MTPTCSVCHGSLHVRQGKVWVRCVCIQQTLSDAYIKPSLKGADDHPLWTDAPLPMRRVTVTGDLRGFRHWVWSSLLHYEPQGVAYDYMHIERIVDVQMKNDPEYTSLYDLVNLDLLVLVIPSYVYKNPLTPSVALSLLDQRLQRPTWVYCGLSARELNSRFETRDFGEALFTSDTLHVTHPSAPPVSHPLLVGGRRELPPRQSHYPAYGGLAGGHRQGAAGVVGERVGEVREDTGPVTGEGILHEPDGPRLPRRTPRDKPPR